MAVRALYRRAQRYIRKHRSGAIRNTLRAFSGLPGIGGYVTAARRAAGYLRRVRAVPRMRRVIRSYRRR